MTETYQYYDLPFCQPLSSAHKAEDLGEVLEGDRMIESPYDVNFNVDKEDEVLCTRTLSAADLKKFRTAVKEDYYFQVRTLAAGPAEPSHLASGYCCQGPGVLGGIAGKNSKSEFGAPCRTNKYPREIPTLPWYRQAIPQVSDMFTISLGKDRPVILA
eukprot:SM000019S04953  [mRNA]  locus=s19:151027:154427:- [translate_table: standard]